MVVKCWRWYGYNFINEEWLPLPILFLEAKIRAALMSLFWSNLSGPLQIGLPGGGISVHQSETGSQKRLQPVL